nr:immunoglobulin light chain junction region [Macaca mulatta]MOX69129.1 immunoglobulin light chain junction region [Macaca mulatta]MOX69155.1 immunoglobulin light chain junction region [Macaca mulatta]MOX69230.1 immunoglobulin light chain junction region [Macaca mulatta]MOX69287.1 immunoglobulin light chain junction region [Macaca mulatta]
DYYCAIWHGSASSIF